MTLGCKGFFHFDFFFLNQFFGGNSHFIKNYFVEMYKKCSKNKWFKDDFVENAYFNYEPKAWGGTPEVLGDERTD
jgi:hypothetical protein